MIKPALPVLLAMCLPLLAACSHDHDSAPVHAHEAPAGDAAHDDHGHGGGVVVTHYTGATELFVEYAPLLVGTESAFAAHLTWLTDFRAVGEGTLEVTLSGGGHPEERATAAVSTTPGIFRPAVTPRFPGERRLVLTLTARETTSVHDLGTVTVDADAAAAATHADHAADADAIAFTKELQWRIPFASVPAEVREVRESIAATARLRPAAAAEAFIAAPAAGRLRPAGDGFPHVGMEVVADQVLADLVPTLATGIDAATLDLAVRQARIHAAHATSERHRLEALLAIEAVARKRVSEARHDEELAQARLRAAEQRAGSFSGIGGGIALRSPVAGTVLAVDAAPGAAVPEGRTLFHVAALDTLWLEAFVPEQQLGRITIPAGAFFRIEGATGPTVLETGFNARLVAFGGLVDAETRTVPLILEFANPGMTLRAGMHLQVRLYTGSMRRGTAVPRGAVLDDGGETVVFVQAGGERFERRVVVIGPDDGSWQAIESGVEAGERVVTTGAHQVRLAAVAAVAPAALGHGHAH